MNPRLANKITAGKESALSKDLKPTPSADPFMGAWPWIPKRSFLRSKVSGGRTDIFDRLLDDLVAAADMPKPLLFGTSPAGGLSESGKYEDKVWAATIERYQNQSLRRVLTQYFTIIVDGRRPYEWSVAR